MPGHILEPTSKTTSDTALVAEPVSVRPPDFDAYWDAVDADLARYPAAAEVTPYPAHETGFATGYGVRLTSVGPYRIFGFLSVPKGEGPFPALLQTPRYGSVNNPPHWDERQRFVVLALMHRGQRLADEPFAAAYPGLLTHGIDDPATYVYRGIVADCLRGAEFLLGRPEVDRGRVGVVGDDLAIVTAARRPGFAALLPANLLFYRLVEASARTDAYPVEEVNDHLRCFPERAGAVARTVAYVDPLHHASRVTAATLLATGDAGSLSDPAWLAPLTAALGGATATYALTHEGGTDRDRLDAWLAGRLGVAPAPRVWSVGG
jgi:cephalosporin-C deacetylase-like acetyl esterase